jgi:hypothetical protein
MAEVEAAVNPDALFVDLDVFLRAHGPVALYGNPFALRTLEYEEGEMLNLKPTFALWRRTMVGWVSGMLE